MEIDPLKYGLSAKVKLQQVDENSIAIVRKIKSRIIQKDAAKIVSQAKLIQSQYPQLRVCLCCTSNICSKSLALLSKEGVEVLMEEI